MIFKIPNVDVKKHYSVDVTITATTRISIFSRTISSFMENLFNDYLDKGHKFRIILNVDPVGNEGSLEDFTRLMDKYCSDTIVTFPKYPNFPKAFKSVWKSITADYVFHLEDDWELLQKVDLLHLINILESEEDLAILRLAAFHAGLTTMKNWNKFFPYNGRYYECPEEMKTSLGFCGHPSLIKAEFVRNTVKFLDENRNPEKQFHSRGLTKIMQEVVKWRYGVYSVLEYPPLIRDIGRKWMVENNFKKEGCKAHFVNWEKT